MQPVVAVIVLTVLVILFLISWNDGQRAKKKIRAHLRDSFGQRPDDVDEIDSVKKEAVSIYYNFIRSNIPEDEIVDDITWNDLEMDKIFTAINTTRSFAGEQVLYSTMHQLQKDKSGILKREAVIEFYSTRPEERENTQLAIGRLKKDQVSYHIPEYIELLEMQRIPFIRICRLLLVSLVVLAAAAVVTMNQWVAAAAGVNFLINIFLYTVGKSKYEVFMDSLSGIIGIVKTAKFLNSQEIPGDRTRIQESLQRLNRISGMIGALEHKKQAGIAGDIAGFISDYLIGSLMWDFIVYDKLVRRLSGRQKEFMKVYQYVGEMDMCIAIASFRKSLPGYCIPSFDEKRLVMESVYHPLIRKPVKNSLDMKKNILLTGSNASGKSTFVKAAAVNIILGQSLHTCAAEKMTVPNVGVLTSMAVRDDILSGESYYMKEIRYLGRMIERSNEKRMIFCGIDEILRGTNTVERVAASIAVLEYLDHKNCLIMVATHDRELTKELADQYENYYFCERLDGNDVSFDYQLYSGVSQSHNAIRLLQAVGFPQEVIKSAEKRVIFT